MLRSGVSSAAYFPLSATKWAELESWIERLEADVSARQENGQLAPGLEEQFRIQIDALRDDTIPDCEILCFPGLNSRRGEHIHF